MTGRLGRRQTACRMASLGRASLVACTPVVRRRAGRAQAQRALDAVGLGMRGNAWPSALSGGQRRPVALARALVHRPRLLLLDELLGALDASSRIVMQQLIVMQQQIVRLWRQHGFALVLVTHDVAEASALADRIVVLDHGKVGLDVAGPCRIRVRPGCRRWRRSRHRCCRVCWARHRCRSQLPRRRRRAMRHPARRRHRKPRRCNASPSSARVGLSSRDHTGPCAPFHPPPRATRGVAGGCVTPA